MPRMTSIEYVSFLTRRASSTAAPDTAVCIPTTEVIECGAGDLQSTLDRLKAEGRRVSSMDVKGATYRLTVRRVST